MAVDESSYTCKTYAVYAFKIHRLLLPTLNRGDRLLGASSTSLDCGFQVHDIAGTLVNDTEWPSLIVSTLSIAAAVTIVDPTNRDYGLAPSLERADQEHVPQFMLCLLPVDRDYYLESVFQKPHHCF